MDCVKSPAFLLKNSYFINIASKSYVDDKFCKNKKPYILICLKINTIQLNLLYEMRNKFYSPPIGYN